MISTGLVPAEGTCSKSGEKNSESRNRMPQTTELRPVLAPALMEEADSGETKMGAEVTRPDSTVKMPHTMKIHLPRGIVSSSLVNTARLLREVMRPLRYST